VRGRLACVAVVTVALMMSAATAASAFGYRDRGFDPDDRSSGPDIRSTTRKVWVGPHGHAWLTIRLDAYTAFGLYWEAIVRLDAEGGPLADHRMTLHWLDLSGTRCGVRDVHRHRSVEGLFRQGDGISQDSTWASCRVPLRAVDPTKRIRWKVLGVDLYGGDTVYDEFAPNGRGWYG
jgi:hypothetical protein